MRVVKIFSFLASVILSSQIAAQTLVGGCDGCDMMFQGMPQNLTWKTKISSEADNGEPLIMSGTIFKPDGKTPAPGVILYVYHTDNKGIYAPAAGQVDAKRHGHLRGWMKTDAQGKYEFTTIRPASYPNTRITQHIHPIIQEPSSKYYYIDEYLFTDDPFLTESEKARQEKRGGSGILTLKKNAQGVWIGKRDIVLGQNIPGY
jgi:protocatechuate 3,4-dioxygenase beta subunit